MTCSRSKNWAQLALFQTTHGWSVMTSSRCWRASCPASRASRPARCTLSCGSATWHPVTPAASSTHRIPTCWPLWCWLCSTPPPPPQHRPQLQPLPPPPRHRGLLLVGRVRVGVRGVVMGRVCIWGRGVIVMCRVGQGWWWCVIWGRNVGDV